ncbi:MAG: FeoB small GTPase domain-containing protein [Planctomycetota bacterium]|jgi:ferrous iron transport protein B
MPADSPAPTRAKEADTSVSPGIAADGLPGAPSGVPGGAEPPPRILLVGNPNVGKSVIFGLLTRRYAVVSNYPGTTVEVSRGTARVGGRRVEVVDTPGANSLSPNSEDERVARDCVLASRGSTVVQVADAKNLRRALLITAQLAELAVPTVVALNMWDEARDRGIEIDLDAVREALGVPVVPMVATEGRGLRALVAAAAKQGRPPTFRVDYGEGVEGAAEELAALLPGRDGARGLSLMLLAGDRALEDSIAHGPEAGGPDETVSLRDAVARLRGRLAERARDPVAIAIQRRRAARADDLVARAVTRRGPRETAEGVLRSVAFLAALPALFYAMGWLLAAKVLYGSLEDGFSVRSFGDVARLIFLRGPPRFAALGWAWSAVLAHGAGLVSAALYSVSALRREYRGGGTATAAFARLSVHPVGGAPLLLFMLWVVYRIVGVLAAGTCVDFLEGEVFGSADPATGAYGGWVNGPLSRALAGVAGRGHLYDFFFSPTAGLVSTGLTYAVAIVLPIVTFFFLAFAFMEDSGYLPRLAMMSDRVFKRMGLSGKAALPMVLGLGCGTMATMTTRVLETRKQRLIAILLLALAVPCSAQLGIITGILARISAGALVFYVGAIVASLFGVGWLASRIVPGGGADLLIEIPPFRIPSARNAVVKTYHRVKWFMREAVPIFLLGTVVLFVAERTGVLRAIEYVARPVVTGLLGLPVETTKGFILGFLRRDFGAVIVFQQFHQGAMGPGQALVALVVMTLFVPCIAHLFVCIRELGWKRALLMDAGVFAFAFIAGGAVRGLVALTGVAG